MVEELIFRKNNYFISMTYEEIWCFPGAPFLFLKIAALSFNLEFELCSNEHAIIPMKQ